MPCATSRLPYVLQLARLGWRGLAAADPGVAEGVNITGGRVTNLAVAQTFGLPYHPLDDTASAVPGDGAGVRLPVVAGRA